MEFKISQLKEMDKPMVLDLISMDHLRPEGILEEGTAYWGAFADDRLVGVIGCEYENAYGLLRSAFVHEQYRKKGIAEELTKILFQAAKEKGLKAIYLFSTGAGAYWAKLGFKEASVSEAVENLANTPQVRLFEKLGWLPTETAFSLSLANIILANP